uniref:SPX domain-containing protein n=2 Tax=Macrostomum lignano TaxID=282301 RepID=A0A1I8HUH4_9PLAT
LIREVRHFQRVQEEPDECQLPWSLFYTHCRGSLDLPLREQIRLRYRQPDVEFAAEDKGKAKSEAGIRQSLVSLGSSLDEYSSRLEDDDVVDSYHRLLVSFGNRVEWQLYFKSEELLQRRVRDLIGSLTLALLENSDSAAPEIETRIGTAITSILVESLTGLINRFSRKWRMVFMSDHQESIAAMRSDYERTAVKLRSFLHVSRLSFLAPMLRPNPEYSSTAQAPDSNPKRSVALVAAATVEISSAMSPAADRGNAGNSGASGASAGGALQQGRSAPRLSLETQNVAWPSQQIWA